MSSGDGASRDPALARGLASAVSLAGIALVCYGGVAIQREMQSLRQARDRAEEQAARAEEHAARALERVAWAEEQREVTVARERELTYLEIHEHLLPVVDAVARGGPLTEGLVRLAVREATRARHLLADGRLEAGTAFECLLLDIRDTYLDAGLELTVSFRIVVEPPPEVAEALTAATREAMSNAAKYCRDRRDVNLYAESTEAGVEIVVRDHGPGFDIATVDSAGGIQRTATSLKERGGAVEIISRPGWGTEVSLRWPVTIPPRTG